MLRVTRCQLVFCGVQIQKRGQDMVSLCDDVLGLDLQRFGEQWTHTPRNSKARHQCDGLLRLGDCGIGEGTKKLQFFEASSLHKYLA